MWMSEKGEAMLSAVRSALGRLESLAESVSILSMALIMVLISADVVARYFFHAPLGITYSLTTLYLMVSLFFLGFASTLSSHNHISVELFLNMLSPRWQRVCMIVTYGLCAPIFAYITISFARSARESFVKSEAVMGTIMWPVWPPLAIVAVGMLLLTLRFAVDFTCHVATLLTGAELAELPTSSGEENGAKA